jgi:Holliday junction resolvasome RuvABC endonuclease subunit
MKTVLALDLGTKMGWALSRCGGFGESVTHGVENLQPFPKGPRAHRFAAFQEWLEPTPADVIVYEDIKRHAGTAAAHMWGAWEGILLAHCIRNGIPAHVLGVGEIKKHATGKGNAPKNDVIAAMQARGFSPEDDNDADALALLFAYLDKEDSE